MSPSEADLRAALQDGEGDGPNVNVVISSAHAQRARRRTQLLGTMAVAAVVAGAGLGVAQLGGTPRNASNGSAAAGVAGGARAPLRANPPSDNSARSAASATPAVACPHTAPRYALPGGGSPGQFGSGGPVFDKPVSALVACAYRDRSAAGASSRVVLRGGDAERVVNSIENAAKQPVADLCPAYQLALTRQLAIVGVTADGTTTQTVTAPLGVAACATTVTNGTAIRYDWSPPAALLTALTKASPGGVQHGSPIKS